MAIDKPGGVSRELVVAAYQVLLGREPENERVILDKMGECQSVRGLLAAFMDSAEFKNKSPHRDYASEVDACYHGPLNQIDVDVPPAVFSRLFARVRDQWTALGDSEPYWSVLSHDRFRVTNIEKTKEEFYASGARSEQLIDVFCKRSDVPAPSGTCLELGCGVGRVTRFLAKRFSHVTGIDISQGILDLASVYLRDNGTRNVDLILLRDLKQLEEIKKFDFFFSVIVLQHNPPPIIAKMLSIIMKNLRRGGGFFFQVPTHTPGYQFNAQSYLEFYDPVGDGFEMHAVPMYVVLDIIEKAGGRVKEVIPDRWTGECGSHTFFGTKD